MNANLLTVIKQIVAEQGEDILSEPRRVSAFFADLARDIPKPQKNAFIKCLEHNFAQIMKNAGAPNREACKQQLAKRLEEDEGFNPVLCDETLELLAAVLFGEKKKEEQKKAYCKKCGKELQEEWKTCPYCSVQAAGTSPPVGSSAPSTATQTQADTVLVNPTTNNMVRINGGTFTMGSPANEPGHDVDEVQHQVTVSSFYMGKYEVTQKEYQEIMGKNPSHFKGDNLPVEQVSWYDAVEFCNKLSQKEGLTPAYTISGLTVTWDRSANGYRLPTEAEWEYACRAGTTTANNTGASINDNTSWYSANSGNMTHPVGGKPANAWGLYDMHGNVHEWCWDWYGEYASGTQTDPVGPLGIYRVARGGSWYVSAVDVRSAYRIKSDPYYRSDSIGFRLVRP